MTRRSGLPQADDTGSAPGYPDLPRLRRTPSRGWTRSTRRRAASPPPGSTPDSTRRSATGPRRASLPVRRGAWLTTSTPPTSTSSRSALTGRRRARAKPLPCRSAAQFALNAAGGAVVRPGDGGRTGEGTPTTRYHLIRPGVRWTRNGDRRHRVRVGSLMSRRRVMIKVFRPNPLVRRREGPCRINRKTTAHRGSTGRKGIRPPTRYSAGCSRPK